MFANYFRTGVFIAAIVVLTAAGCRSAAASRAAVDGVPADGAAASSECSSCG